MCAKQDVAIAYVDEAFPVPQPGSAMPTLSIKLPKQLRAKLAAAAKHRGITQSAFVRQAIEVHLRMPEALSSGLSLFDQMSDLIGIADDGPPDLATNPVHMEGLGLDGPARRKLKLVQQRRRSRQPRTLAGVSR